MPDDPFSLHAELDALPSLDDAPVPEEWLHRGRRGARGESPSALAPPPPPPGSPAPSRAPAAAAASAPAPTPPTTDIPVDPRRFYIPSPNTLPPAPPRPARPEPTPDGPPGPPAGPPRRRGRSRGRWVRRIALVLALLVVAEAAYLLVQYRSIDRLDMGDALGDSASGTNYLLVGTDSREGVDPDNPNAGVIFGDGVSGERTDTMVIVHVGDGGDNVMMAVPRDLFVTINPTGEQQRINAAIQQGPAALVSTISDNLGVPIDHYIEVDFAGFLGVVDAIGGVVVDFPHPAIDTNSGLFIEEAGPQRLDSDQALAYVRSRHYTEIIDGEPVTDPTADLGRVSRQQDFLRTVFSDVGSARNPLTVNRIVSSVSGNVRIDDELGFFGLLDLARRMGGLNPETIVLPVRGGTTDGGASVLFLQDGEAQPVLDRLR